MFSPRTCSDIELINRLDRNLFLEDNESLAQNLIIAKKQNADLDALLDNNETLLIRAVRTSNIEAAGLLLKNGANVNASTPRAITPLFAAVTIGGLELIKLLIRHRANPNCCLANGETPLYTACLKNKKDIVRSLLAIPGIEIDKTTNIGATSLFAAAQEGHLEIVKMLYKKGARTDLKVTVSKDQLTISLDAEAIAQKRGHAEVAMFLNKSQQPSWLERMLYRRNALEADQKQQEK